MIKKGIFLAIISIISFRSFAQELNIDVQVKAPRIVSTDPKVFESLENQISEFLNQTKWTEDEFEDFEKIEGNVNVTITEDINGSTFVADIFVQTIRPVFKSTYKTQVLNLVDNGVRFSYIENQPIENSTQNYFDPLSSVLTYYAYMIIAYDYDTFSSLGGDPYFTIAQNIVNGIPANTPNAPRDWGALGNRRNKYWMVENMMNPRVRPMRQALYEYYIQSLDKMSEDIDKSKAIMVSSLSTIQQVHASYPNSSAVQMFADSKRKEIVEIFKGSSKGQQNKVYDIMVKIDPAQSSEYNALR